MQRGLDAIRATVDADPHLKRDAIEFLFAEGFWDREKLKSWDAAVARFNGCLNPQKPEFWKVSELWALMKRFGRHDLLHAIAADLGYQLVPIPTEARRQALLQRVAEAYERAGLERDAALAEFARLEPPAPTPHMDPAIRAGGHFSLPRDVPETF